jgi:hypothetical protein
MQKGNIYLNISLISLSISVILDIVIFLKLFEDPRLDLYLRFYHLTIPYLWFPLICGFISVVFGILARANLARPNLGCAVNTVIGITIVNLILSILFICFVFALYYLID